MAKPIVGEQDTEKSDIELSKAVRTVYKAVSAEEDRLKEIADGQEHEPLMLIGQTSEQYEVHVMVDDVSKVAQIMLDYDYPLYSILGEDAPQEMWDALAAMVGLESAYSVDM